MMVRALLVALGAAATLAACSGDDRAEATASDAGIPEGGAAPASDAGVPLCVNGQPTSAWPPGPYGVALGATLPENALYADIYEPCASESRLLVIRSAPAWCGSCGWHATHTTRLFGDFTARVRLLDLLIADEDNMPPDNAALARWRTRVDLPNGLDYRSGIDALYMFQATLAAPDVLPEYVLVDTRTMRALNVQANPAPEQLQSFFNLELALLDGKDRPNIQAPALHDNLLTEDQWDLAQDIVVPDAPPADPTNEVADLPAAAAFGQTLFSDLTLSPTGTVACATCHDPAKTFTDGLPVAEGVAKGDRNSPAIALAAHARWQFWDGRADTLWMQALAPFENDREIAGSRLFVAHAIVDRYSVDYTAIFGSEYPLPDLSALPAAGKPGDAAYDALAAGVRDDVTRVFVNVGKSIAAYERSLRVAPNALDRYAAGDTTALASDQRTSLQQFFALGCIQCHYGPRLTDDAFHAIGFPTGRADGAPDRGRADVLLGLAASEFLASSKWSDSPSSAKSVAFSTVPATTVGAFKTPSLRGVATTAPYGHGGAYAALGDVTRHYGTRGSLVEPNQTVGTVEPWLPHFDTQAQTELVALLNVLTGASP